MTAHNIKSKHIRKDRETKPLIVKRQKDRKFLEQLDDFMAAVNCELTGTLNTQYNRTLASK